MAPMLTSKIVAEASPLVKTIAPVRRPAAFKPVTSYVAPVNAVSVTPCRLSGIALRRSIIAEAKKGKGASAEVVDSPKGGKGGKGGKGAAEASGDTAKVEKEAKADAEDRMKKAVAALADNLNTIRTGRANPAILDRIMVDQFGSPTPIKRVASISVPEATTLLISPFDKASLKPIEKALLESDIGINPTNDGEKIRLVVPPLTQERRKELAKTAAKFGEESKVAVRNVRTDVKKKIDKVELPKDSKKDLEDALQKITDQYVKKIDEVVKTKTDEVMKL
eukprot:CAMPEP_0202889804 /NCGR_PEP_ID=MMETSP1392-20130828/367_1 /ASSEMBLY_ACC=CAM_ASM_000868 /TAXON_ID=225041 /ORGANISM="Chlamydomonas chlamydogama, Strain SAG 11-48b" /LENGTH=278 /DNA_ID=CAMNT_0049573215 /DNA_START=23 /DNA_END=859 /DNA_ORIENTATION=+